MILVTLGTHPKPMNRLVSALDALLASGDVTDEIIITAAAYDLVPVHATALQIQPFAVLDDLAHRADAIVTHGGPASITLAMAAGHLPVVVPRDPAYGEHVDDHQIRFARWLSKRRPIAVVLEMDALGDALNAALRRGADSSNKPGVPTEVIERLRTIIGS